MWPEPDNSQLELSWTLHPTEEAKGPAEPFRPETGSARRLHGAGVLSARWAGQGSQLAQGQGCTPRATPLWSQGPGGDLPEGSGCPDCPPAAGGSRARPGAPGQRLSGPRAASGAPGLRVHRCPRVSARQEVRTGHVPSGLVTTSEGHIHSEPGTPRVRGTVHASVHGQDAARLTAPLGSPGETTGRGVETAGMWSDTGKVTVTSVLEDKSDVQT